MDEKGNGRNMVGIVLTELRQGLIIKQKLERETRSILESDKKIKNYIVAYQLLNTMIEEGKDIKPYFGSNAENIIKQYVNEFKQQILDSLKKEHGNLENVNVNLQIENKIEDVDSLTELSFNDKLKILGYNEINLGIYLEDYKENRYPILNDIIKSENEPRKIFLANTLYKNKKIQIDENKKEIRKFLIVVNFLAYLKNVDLNTKEDENNIYSEFLSETTQESFEILSEKIVKYFEENKHDALIMIKIQTALSLYDKQESEEEYDDEEEKSNSKETSESSESEIERKEIEKRSELFKVDKIFDLMIELKDDKALENLSQNELLKELKILLSNFNFKNPQKVFEIILKPKSLGFFGNQEYITKNKLFKNYGEKVSPTELLVDLNGIIRNRNEKNIEQKFFLKDIEIVEIEQERTVKYKIIKPDDILSLFQLNSVIKSGYAFPSPAMYVTAHLYSRFCGVNIGLKAVDIDQIKINDLIDDFQFENIENKLEEKITRGTDLQFVINKLSEDIEGGDFVDIFKASSIFDMNVEKTHQILTVFLLLKAISAKFKNHDLRKVLILSENATINYTDNNNLFLGQNDNGANIMGYILMAYRTYLKQQNFRISTMNLYDVLTSSFNKSWCENMINDMCTIVYRLKYFLNTNIDSVLINHVLKNLYSFFEIKTDKIPKLPVFIIEIVKDCYGMELNIPQKLIDDYNSIQNEIVKIKNLIDGVREKANPYRIEKGKKEGVESVVLNITNPKYNELVNKIKENFKAQQKLEKQHFDEKSGFSEEVKSEIRNFKEQRKKLEKPSKTNRRRIVKRKRIFL